MRINCNEDQSALLSKKLKFCQALIKRNATYILYCFWSALIRLSTPQSNSVWTGPPSSALVRHYPRLTLLVCMQSTNRYVYCVYCSSGLRSLSLCTKRTICISSLRAKRNYHRRWRPLSCFCNRAYNPDDCLNWYSLLRGIFIIARILYTREFC